MSQPSESLVPLKNSLKQTVKFQQISDKILELLKVVPDIESLKHSNELIQYICNLIELYSKKKYKINKKNLLLFTMNRVLTLTEEDMNTIKSTVQYLHENKPIKKITYLSKILNLGKKSIKAKTI